MKKKEKIIEILVLFSRMIFDAGKPIGDAVWSTTFNEVAQEIEALFKEGEEWKHDYRKANMVYLEYVSSKSEEPFAKWVYDKMVKADRPHPCSKCGEEMRLYMYDRPFSPPGNTFICQNISCNEDWASPNYDPYADTVLGRVDRYFEDNQGIVDTTIIK